MRYPTAIKPTIKKAMCREGNRQRLVEEDNRENGNAVVRVIELVKRILFGILIIFLVLAGYLAYNKSHRKPKASAVG